MGLKHKVIFISGASRGIGRAAALAFAKEGAKLALTYRSHVEEGKTVAEECEKAGAEDVLLLPLDVADNTSVRKTIEQAVAHFGGIDVLVNNAGVFYWEPFPSRTFEDIEHEVRTNLEGLIKLTHAGLPHVRESILNISSGAGKSGSANMAVYCATKFGVRGFIQSLAREFPKLYIVSVNPDTTATAMTDFEGRPPEEVAEVILKAAKRIYPVPSGGDLDVWELV